MIDCECVFNLFGISISVLKVKAGGYMGNFGSVSLLYATLGFLMLLSLWIIIAKLKEIIVILKKMQKIKIKFYDEAQYK